MPRKSPRDLRRASSSGIRARAIATGKLVPGDNPLGAPDSGGTREPAQEWEGEVIFWHPVKPSGYIKAGGIQWFVTCRSLPAGVERLKAGTRVTFTGSPVPPPGKGAPEAFEVRVAGSVPGGSG